MKWLYNEKHYFLNLHIINTTIIIPYIILYKEYGSKKMNINKTHIYIKGIISTTVNSSKNIHVYSISHIFLLFNDGVG